MGDALDGRGKLAGADDSKLIVVAGHDGFEVGELAGELARAQRAMADAEEEGVLVVGEFDLFGLGVGEQLLQLLEGLAGDEDALLAADAFENLVGLFDIGEAMAVGGDHGQRLGLDDQQCAVERVARLFVGDCKNGAIDERLECLCGDAGGGDGGEFGNLRVVGAGHADHFGVGAAGANLDPVVVEQLDGDVAIGEDLT